MGINREQAIEIAAGFYSRGSTTVIRLRSELVGLRVDVALVLTHVTYSGDVPEFDVPGPQIGPGWWVAFAELWRKGECWEPADTHTSGGLVRVCEETGAVFRPTLL